MEALKQIKICFRIYIYYENLLKSQPFVYKYIITWRELQILSCVNVSSSIVTNVPHQWGMFIMGETTHVWGRGYMGNLYHFTLNFAVN